MKHMKSTVHAPVPPLTLEATGLEMVLCRDIMLKTMFRRNLSLVSDIASALCVVPTVVSELIELCRESGLVETLGVRGSEGASELRYQLTDGGKSRALDALEQSEYYGALPVTLDFVATDYALLVWGLQLVGDAHVLLSPDNLRDDLENWLSRNAVMKKTFRNAAQVAGLIDRNLPGQRKSGKQATFSSDILYDTLLKYDPDHLLMQITRIEAERGLVDFGRIEEMLRRIDGRIDLVHAPHVTPFAAPLLLEVGKVPISGQGRERLMELEAETLMADAGLA